MAKGKTYIGTSGWHYKHWIGTFYPEGTKDAEQMGHYLASFKTVEINNSFYRLPTIKTFSTWRDAVPEGFVFAVKASRFITHMKKLKVDRASISKFFTRIKRLENKAGPVLFQLPPGWKLNIERLEEFIQHLPEEHRYTFEFRNQTWYTEDVYEVLRKYNCSFCIYELEHHLTPMVITADFVYIRLHGPGNKYQGSYAGENLEVWADIIKTWTKEGKDVYVYFDNDQAGYAAFNAVTLQKMVQ